MKKTPSQFNLFERTKTPNGIMMRVMGGWELNGAFIPDSEKFEHVKMEVYEDVEQGNE